ncbi:MAG TPA: response regulator [Clostridia bacterium]|nr:response regulator [Clostridia bacterium]
MYKLLIADDETEILEGLRTIIDWESNGVTLCGEACNGIEALEMINRLSPDIMIMDIRMPLLDGLELLAKISQNGLPVKCIILSGYDDFYYAQKAIDLKAANYLLKPCRPKDILEAVLKVKAELDEKKQQEALFIKYKLQLQENPPALTENTNKLVKTAIDFIYSNYSKDITLDCIAKEIYITPGYLSQLFKQETGVNFLDFLNQYRIQKAKEYLTGSFLKNYEVSGKVGFKDEKYFSQVFKRYTGLTPSQYRDRGVN